MAPQPPYDGREWNNFVARSPFGDVLQCLEWGEIKQPEWRAAPACVASDGQLSGTALGLARKIPRTRRSILYVPRGPILDWSEPGLLERTVARLREVAAEHKAVLIKVDPAVPAATPGVADQLRRLGFVPSPDASGSFGGTQPRFVMKLDISGSETEVQNRFHAKWRYNIRLAEKKGVTVRQDCSREDLKAFHELYRVTAERNGFRGRPLRYFEKMWDVLVQRDMARLFVTMLGDQPLSAAICFVLPPQCWYVYGASSNEHRNLMPNHLMQWTMMQWARDKGCAVYDFRGVPDPTRRASTEQDGEGHDGLVRFKTGFGAQLVEYVGEWDLPTDRAWYWLWATARPRLAASLKRMRDRSNK